MKILEYGYLLVWYNQNTKKFYYKKYVGFYYSLIDKKVGFKNSYGHEVVFVINLEDIYYKVSFKKRLINRLIRFLENKK